MSKNPVHAWINLLGAEYAEPDKSTRYPVRDEDAYGPEYDTEVFGYEEDDLSLYY